jgi:hypothetical protein
LGRRSSPRLHEARDRRGDLLDSRSRSAGLAAACICGGWLPGFDSGSEFPGGAHDSCGVRSERGSRGPASGAGHRTSGVFHRAVCSARVADLSRNSRRACSRLGSVVGLEAGRSANAHMGLAGRLPGSPSMVAQIHHLHSAPRRGAAMAPSIAVPIDDRSSDPDPTASPSPGSRFSTSFTGPSVQRRRTAAIQPRSCWRRTFRAAFLV